MRVVSVFALILEPGFCQAPSFLPTYPIQADVVTTRQRTVRPTPLDPDPYVTPPVPANNVLGYLLYGYTGWQFGPPADEGRLFLTPGEATAASGAARLLNFFSMSDLHVGDFQSPAGFCYLDWIAGFGSHVSPSRWAPSILSTSQVLDAAVQTANALHRQTPFDFGIFLGDAADNTQYNELRRYIDTIDGRTINPTRTIPPTRSRTGPLTI